MLQSVFATIQARLSRLPWLQKNWKWFLPCVLLGMPTVIGLGTAQLVLSAFDGIKKTPPVLVGYSIARTDPRVRTRLGTPLSDDGFSDGSSNGQEVDINVPLSGPKASGRLRVAARNEAGQWSISALRLNFEDRSPSIDLMAALESGKPFSSLDVSKQE